MTHPMNRGPYGQMFNEKERGMYCLWIKSGSTREEAANATWQKVRCGFSSESKARDAIGSNRAVMARMGIRFSQFKVTKEGEE